MRRNKGAALPTAIALCTFLLLISFVVATLITQISIINLSNNVDTKHELLFSESHSTFVKNNGDISSITNNSYRWRTYNADDPNVKALVAFYNTEDKVKFYSIYDFNTNKTLAYQLDVIYAPLDTNNHMVLGGLVTIGEIV